MQRLCLCLSITFCRSCSLYRDCIFFHHVVSFVLAIISMQVCKYDSQNLFNASSLKKKKCLDKYAVSAYIQKETRMEKKRFETDNGKSANTVSQIRVCVNIH